MNKSSSNNNNNNNDNNDNNDNNNNNNISSNKDYINDQYCSDLEESDYNSGEASILRLYEESKNRLRTDVRKQLTTILRNTLRQEGGKIYAVEEGELLVEEARKILNNG